MNKSDFKQERRINIELLASETSMFICILQIQKDKQETIYKCNGPLEEYTCLILILLLLQAFA